MSCPFLCELLTAWLLSPYMFNKVNEIDARVKKSREGWDQNFNTMYDTWFVFLWGAYVISWYSRDILNFDSSGKCASIIEEWVSAQHLQLAFGIMLLKLQKPHWNSSSTVLWKWFEVSRKKVSIVNFDSLFSLVLASILVLNCASGRWLIYQRYASDYLSDVLDYANIKLMYQWPLSRTGYATLVSAFRHLQDLLCRRTTSSWNSTPISSKPQLDHVLAVARKCGIPWIVQNGTRGTDSEKCPARMRWRPTS